MEFILPALGVILLIFIVVMIVRFVKFIFTNYLVSRILSLVCGVISLIFAFPTMGALASGDTYEMAMVCILASVFQWLFYIGPVVFDVEWDGTWRFTETSYGYEATPNMTGGFIANFIGAAIIAFIAYMAIGPEFPAICLVIPIGLGILNIVNFLRWR